MNINNISIERLEQIEREREQTQSDPAYHKWIAELNVSAHIVEETDCTMPDT